MTTILSGKKSKSFHLSAFSFWLKNGNNKTIGNRAQADLRFFNVPCTGGLCLAGSSLFEYL